MPTIDLTEQEVQQILTIISTKATWVEANPLLRKIGEQMAKQMDQSQIKGNAGAEHVMPQPREGSEKRRNS